MDISSLDRQGLLDYIETLEAKTASLEAKMEELKAQADLLDFDPEEFKVPDGAVPELKVSEETADALAEAASIFDDFSEVEVDPAPVENGVVRLEPVVAEETYIPVKAPADTKPAAARKAVKVKVRKPNK